MNLFVIPTGMMFGAKATIAQWIVWNLIPATLGNFLGGFLFTGLPYYLTFRKRSAAPYGAAEVLGGKDLRPAVPAGRPAEGALELR